MLKKISNQLIELAVEAASKLGSSNSCHCCYNDPRNRELGRPDVSRIRIDGIKVPQIEIPYIERENGNQYRDGAYIDSGFTDAMCVEEIDQKDQKNVVSRQDG